VLATRTAAPAAGILGHTSSVGNPGRPEGDLENEEDDTMSTERGAWREKIEPGVYKRHRLDCASSRDRRPGRRCSCRLQIAAPGPTPGSSRTVTMPAGATVTDARRERRRLQAAGRPQAAGEVAVGTVHELALAYFRARSPLLAPSTTRTYEDAYRLRVAPHWRETPLDEITRPGIEAWLGQRLEAGDSVHATRKALACLRAMFTFAVRADLLDRNPAFGIELPEPPVDPDAPPAVERVLAPDQFAQLLDACEEVREEALARLAGESGLRSGEVRGLRWPDLDLPARRIRVRRAVWRDIVKVPKSKSSRRRVAITPACAQALGRLYEVEVLGEGQAADGYVFTGRDGVSPMGADTPLEVMQQVQRRAGLVTKRGDKVVPLVTFHELRHTSATTMLNGGKAAAVVARQLGHASSAVTTSVYEHLLHDGLLDDALDVFAGSEVAQQVAQPSEAEAG
jgi:integrase